MAESFDLRTRPWVPVTVGAETVSVGLRELFSRAAEFDDLVVPVPPAAAGLWRILYAITARVTGLDSVGGPQWRRRQVQWLQRGAFDVGAVDAYLDKHGDRFDLFDSSRPWLQDPRLAAQCAKPSGVNKLLFGRPAGNTQVWFGHHTDAAPVPVAASDAAWHLIAQLYYGASGRCTSREVGGQKFANSNAGPLRGAMSYHPLGRNLFESMVIGVPPRSSAGDDSADMCPWERVELPDPLAAPLPVTWPAGLLTGRSRHAVLLVAAAGGEQVQDAYVTWATRHPAGQQPDPYVVRRQNEQGGWYQLPANGARALWRDVDALLADNTQIRRYRPEIMTSVAELGADGRVRAYGFDQDGQAKDRQWFTALTPPVLGWLHERDRVIADGVAALTRAAEALGRRLSVVLRQAWQEMVGVEDREGPWVGKATAYYWGRAEPLFWDLVRQRQFTAGARAYAQLGHAAIDHAAGSATGGPRLVRALQEAHRLLAFAQRTRGADE
jgi:CRISPR system Cascade subunit CasA